LERLVSEGDIIHDGCETDGPGVSIDTYLTRFFKYTPCKKDVFISSLVYLDRKIKNCGMIINSTNVHRQYLTCNLMAAKLVEESAQDFPVNNRLFSIVGGIPLSEMNGLEINFLSTMDFRLHIFPDEFHQYAHAVRSRLSTLKELYNARKGPLEEINSQSTYYIYKQFTENVIMMEKAAQRQYNNYISAHNINKDFPVNKENVLIDDAPAHSNKSKKKKKNKKNRNNYSDRAPVTVRLQ